MKPQYTLLVGVFIGFLCSYTCYLMLSLKSGHLYKGRQLLEISSRFNGGSSREDVESLIDSIQRERRFIKNKACNVLKETNEDLNKNDPDYFPARDFYSKNYNLTVCHIQKCGYSSWYNAFLVIEDYFSVDQYLKGEIIGKQVTDFAQQHITLGSLQDKSDIRKKWLESYKVILVRNPFSRLVSAYYDKMLPTSIGFTHYYGPISRSINTLYRTMRHKKEDRNKADDGTATFEDFVNFLLYDKRRRDEHWRPFYLTCDPCRSDYDYIAKLETLWSDIEFIKNRLGLSKYHRKAFFPKIHFETNLDKTKKEFENVPKDKAELLYKMYKPDFELFGYERPSWL